MLQREMRKKISTSEYKKSTVYDRSNNPLTDDLGIPALNLPPITFDDKPRPHKKACYTPDLLPANISVALENSFSTLTTPSYSLYLLPSDDPNTIHVMKMDVPVLGRMHI